MSLESKFRLSDNQLNLRLNKVIQDYFDVQPAKETAEDLNQDGDLQFNFSLRNNPNDVFDAFVLYEMVIQKKLKTEAFKSLEATDNIAVENDFFPRMFSSISISSGLDSDIEKVQHPGIVSSINQLLSRSQDYVQGRGQLNMFIPDTGKGDEANTEYIKRKNIVGINGFQGSYPLSNVSGFLNLVRYSMNNLDFTVTFTRKFSTSFEDVLMGTKAADTEYRIQFSKIRLLFTYTALSEEAKLQYLKQIPNSVEKFPFLQNRCDYVLVPAGDTFNHSIGNVNSPIHEIVVVFKNPTKSINENNSKFISKNGAETVNEIVVNIGGFQFPPKESHFNFDSTKNKMFYPYGSYIKACEERYGVEPMLNYLDFRDLYTLFYFNLQAQDQSLINTNNTVSIQMKKTNAFQPEMYVHVKLEKNCYIDFKDKKFRSISLTTS